MGYFLNQCSSDAWDVIQGRKKIVGNKIILYKNVKEKVDTNEYGWLTPDGTFYPVEFGKHQEWASKYLLKEFQNGNIDLKCGEDPGDKLCEMGFILLHNPYGYNFSVTRDIRKVITRKQRDFLINYFEKRNMKNWMDKLCKKEL